MRNPETLAELLEALSLIPTAGLTRPTAKAIELLAAARNSVDADCAAGKLPRTPGDTVASARAALFLRKVDHRLPTY